MFIFKTYESVNLLSFRVSAVELLSFGLSLHHRVHRFQVGRVGHERHGDFSVADPVHSLVIHPEVIFDITRTLEAQNLFSL